MQRTIVELQNECLARGIPLPYGNNSKKSLIKTLQNYSLNQRQNISWGLQRRVEIESPMLCFSFKNLHKHQQEECLNSKDWIAEKKWNGNRMIVCYHPDEGFTFFSRNISTSDFLPIEYTDKVLLIKDKIHALNSGKFDNLKQSFILDTEVITENANIETSKNKTGSELNAVSTILSINREESHSLQWKQSPLKFMVFDVLYFDRWIKDFHLRYRKHFLEKILKYLNESLPFYNTPYITENKLEFYKEDVKNGGEGIVLKNLNSPYISTTSRKRDVQVKLKRTMNEALGDDVDVFITGFEPGTEGKAHENLVGSLKVSVFLKKGGEERIHHIGTVAGIPLELRKDMTIEGIDGKPKLNPNYLGKVITIDGQNVSPKTKRFMHCRVEDWTHAFRYDKGKFDCVLEERILNEQIR